MITSTLADRSPPDLHLFRNYSSPQDILAIKDFDHPDIHSNYVPSEQLIWRAAKASGAAPSFFRYLSSMPLMLIVDIVAMSTLILQLKMEQSYIMAALCYL